MSLAADFRRVVRRVLTQIGRAAMPFAAIRESHPPVDIPLHMLVSKRTAGMGVLAVQSFEHFSGRSWKVIMHDDGSVTDAQRAWIAQQLPTSRFVTRLEADTRATEHLKSVSLALRGEHNFLMKIFDPLLISGTSAWVCLDADVFFFGHAAEIAQWADRPETFRFMEDTKESYAMSRVTLEETLDCKPACKLNAGLCLIPPQALSLSACEETLAALVHLAAHPMFFDQTLLALAAKDGVGLPPTYQITWDLWRRRDTVCRHYVGASKDDLLYIEGVPTLFWKMTLPALWRRLKS